MTLAKLTAIARYKLPLQAGAWNLVRVLSHVLLGASDPHFVTRELRKRGPPEKTGVVSGASLGLDDLVKNAFVEV